MFSILLAAVLPLVNQPFTYVGRIVSFDHVSADAGAVTIWAYNSSGQFVAKSDTFATTESAYNYRLAIPIASQPTLGYATVGEKLTFRLCDSVDGEDFLALVPVEDSAVGNPGERVRCDLMLAAEADGDGGSDQYVRGITQQLPRYRSPAIEEDTTDYLSFTAVGGDVKITMVRRSTFSEPPERELETSFDRNTWTAFEPGESNVTVAADQTVYFRRPLDKGVILSFASPDDEYASWQFVFDTGDDETVKAEAGGNVMSLLDGTCVSKTVGTNAFVRLFCECSSLTVAPVLPATVLADSCYDSMFYGCSSLTVAPALPATTLAKYCYYEMFYGCSSLTVAPALPATTLAEDCYECMFGCCVALAAAPALPATTLAKCCYYEMFSGCDSLKVAPALPATTLAKYCYSKMFDDCVALTVAPALPATMVAEGCYGSMFAGCESLTVAPALPATTLATGCYKCMFYGCTKLNEISVGFSEWREELEATYHWVPDVASEGTFYCPKELSQTFSSSNIPEGWTVRENVFVNIPTVEHLKTAVTANGSAVTALKYAGSTRWMVKSGAAVQVEFSADEGYGVKGTTSYSIDSLTDDVVFGTTPGYPLPKVEALVGKWTVGEDARAYLYASGDLEITGTGAMYDFASAEDVPWAAFVGDVTAVTIAQGVTHVGKNAFAGMANLETINGEDVESTYRTVSTVNGKPIDQFNMMGDALGNGPLVYPPETPAAPSGAVSGAEPERIKIVDGKVLLGVSVCTNGDLTAATEDWEPAAIEKAQVEEDGTVTLTVPATAEQGFMLLKSKGADPSNRSGRPDTADIQHD